MRNVTLRISGSMRSTALSHLVRGLQLTTPIPFNMAESVTEIKNVSEVAFDALLKGPAPAPEYDTFDAWLAATRTYIEVSVQ